VGLASHETISLDLLWASSATNLYGHFLPFESQHKIDVIFIKYLTVICLDPITPQLVGEDQGKSPDRWKKSRDCCNKF